MTSGSDMDTPDLPTERGNKMPFAFDNKITTGNLITVFMVLLGAGGLWGQLNTTISQLANGIEAVSTRTAALERDLETRGGIRDTQLTQHENRLRAAEIAQASLVAEQRATNTSLAEIKVLLNRMMEARP